jgi:hypothetical protein
MDNLVEITSALIETGNRSPRATAIAVLRALSATLRIYPDPGDLNLEDCADWIDSQLEQTKPFKK